MTLSNLPKLLNKKLLQQMNICHKPSVAWLLLGNRTVGSSRIHGINVHKYLLTKGIRSKIVQSSTKMNPSLFISALRCVMILISRPNVLIFQKVYDHKAIQFAKVANLFGIRTIFLQSDLFDTEMVMATQLIVVTSDYLKQYYDRKYNTNAVVIEDALEIDTSLVKQHTSKDKIQIIWMGHKDNWATLQIIYKALAQLSDESLYLKTISNHPGADVQWCLDSVYDEIMTADIAVIPTGNDEWANAKSNNRLTMFMAMGIPVVASPIPAYKHIITQGHNGFLAESIEDWANSFLCLKDVELRKKIGLAARNSVLPKYTIENIGNQWISIINNQI